MKTIKLLYAADAKDATGSSPDADDKGADSSQQQQDDQTNQQDDASQDDSSTTDDGASTSTDAAGDDQTGDQQDDQSQQQQQKDDQIDQQTAQNVVVDKEEDKALPFHKHPRFQEVIGEKNTFKAELEKAKPLLDQVNAQNEILRTHNIAPQEFQSAIQYLIALRTNPQAAFEMLKPTFEQLSMYVGERLPDDLAAKVAAGTLDPQDAKALAKARGQETYQNARQNWQQNGQQQQVGDVVSQSTSLWLGTKQTIDPDLKEGTPLWEQTNLRLLAMSPARSAQERMQQCETAYKAAKTFLGGLQPKPVVKPAKAPLQSRQQTNGSKFVIKNEADAMKAIKLGLKPHQVSYQ